MTADVKVTRDEALAVASLPTLLMCLAQITGDPAWTEGTLHTLEGLVMVGMGLGLMLCEIAVLDWLLEDEPRPAEEPTAAGPLAVQQRAG